jgi:heterodisulfide reductase subunit B
MKISYYPGCTLKTKAKNLEDSALASMKALGMDVEELPRWNCCGAVHSLSDDDLIHQVAPVRDLIRVLEMGHEKVVTLCSMCYNTLARANLLMKEEEEKRNTINDFMDEEIDYHGEVEVVHFLSLLRDEIGWERLRAKVTVPLKDLKVAPYYGCTLLRPRDIALEPLWSLTILHEFLGALGASVVEFPETSRCCGSYQILGNPEAALEAGTTILESAGKKGAEALVLSCPLCEFNLGRRQITLLEKRMISREIPTFYFTQLLAIALGLAPEICRFELNEKASYELLKSKGYLN